MFAHHSPREQQTLSNFTSTRHSRKGSQIENSAATYHFSPNIQQAHIPSNHSTLQMDWSHPEACKSYFLDHEKSQINYRTTTSASSCLPNNNSLETSHECQLSKSGGIDKKINKMTSSMSTSPVPIAFEKNDQHLYCRLNLSMEGKTHTSDCRSTTGSRHYPTFRDLFMHQICPSMSQSVNLLCIEFVSHLEAIMEEIIPESSSHLHASHVSRIHTRVTPLELSWEIPLEVQVSDPLRLLSAALRRQQPTPLKYLFRLSTSATATPMRFLAVTDLISHLTCEITLNNTWAVLFSHVLRKYTAMNKSVEMATQSIFHWACQSNLIISPPSISFDNLDQRTQARDGTHKVLPTHSNLSVVIIFWLRYLIERFPNSPTVSQLILDGPNLVLLDDHNLTVEDLVINFFYFYKNVDLKRSIISIRAGAPPLFHFESTTNTNRSINGMGVVDPLIDRNLAGSWQSNDTYRFINELQIIPWKNDIFIGRQFYSNETEAEQLLNNPTLASQWLLDIMKSTMVTATTQQLEAFDFYCPDESLSLSDQMTKKHDSCFLLEKTHSFSSKRDLMAENRALRLTQRILSDRVRFLRNDRWWSKRKGSANMHASVSAEACKSDSFTNRSERIMTQSQDIDARFLTNSASSFPNSCNTEVHGNCLVPLNSVRNVSFDRNTEKNSTSSITQKWTRTTLSTTSAAPPGTPSAQADETEDSSNLNDAVNILLELTRVPTDLLDNLNLEPNDHAKDYSQLAPFSVAPPSEYLSESAANHLRTKDGKWERSLEVASFLQDFIKGPSGQYSSLLPLFSITYAYQSERQWKLQTLWKIEKFLIWSDLLNAATIASANSATHYRRNCYGYKCIPHKANLMIFSLPKDYKDNLVRFSVSWMDSEIPSIGTARCLDSHETTETITISDVILKDMPECNMVNTITMELNVLNGSLAQVMEVDGSFSDDDQEREGDSSDVVREKTNLWLPAIRTFEGCHREFYLFYLP